MLYPILLEMSNIIEIENIHPTDVEKVLIHASERAYISAIRRHAFEVCRGNISVSYIKQSFNRFKNGFVYLRNNTVVAFCIWNVRDNQNPDGTFKPALRIRLICSSSTSGVNMDVILYDIDAYCRSKGIKFISLYPANDSLREYYRTKGFVDLYEEHEGSMSRRVDTTVIYRPMVSVQQTRRNRRSERIGISNKNVNIPNSNFLETS
jgi:hypothetical protein